MNPDQNEWHLLRVPTPAQLKRRRGFPADHVEYQGMRRWCTAHCKFGWCEQPTDRHGTVFLFEDRSEAMAFALRWFPFKCG